MKRMMLMAAVATLAALAANAATRYWTHTVKNASDGKYYWSDANNWLDDVGMVGIGHHAHLAHQFRVLGKLFGCSFGERHVFLYVVALDVLQGDA